MKSLTPILFVALLSLTACKSSTSTRIGTAASTPLSDFNIIREKIPPILEDAQKQPYFIPESQNCDAISLEIKELDEVLGADIDAPSSKDSPSLIDRGANLAEDSAIGAIQRTAQDLIPFRSWVRKLTGAEKHSRKVAAAIVAGSIRRAFLKGIKVSLHCSQKQTDKAADITPP
jgi:hypothetical protein